MKTIKNKRGLKEKRYKVNILILVTLTLLISSLCLVNAAEEYKPYLHNPSIGKIPKLETFGEYKTELFPGAGTYVYDIQVPLGVTGLQPSTSLLYNSQSVLQRIGLVGAGWSLTENYIMRNVNHTINNINDDYFVLSLGNNRLKLFYNGTAYNTEIDPRRYRIQNFTNSGKQYWIVTMVDGTQYRFGFNNNSLLESNTGYNYDLKWSLDLVSDTHNNSIFYSYKENPFSGDAGAVYLSNITYNNDRLRLVTFEYETTSRPDRRLIFEQGNMLDESRRLTGISIFFNNSLVRRYSLGYTNLNSESSMSAISNISYIGADNLSVLNSVKFEYYSTSQGFDNSTNKWVVPAGFAFSSTDASGKDLGIRLLDANNDGFPDLVKAVAGTHETQLNNKINGWNSSTLFVIPTGLNIADGSSLDQGLRFDDVNGDGLVDLLQSKQGSARAVYLNNGTGWHNAVVNWSIPLDFITSDSKDLGVELVDLNGDGRVDILCAQESHAILTYLNNGTGWQNVSDWRAPDYFVTSESKDTGLRIVDLNNDGLPDLIKGGKPGSAWLNNGTGWQNYSQYSPDLEFVDQPNRPDLGIRFMDINGDGLQDLLQNFLSNVSYTNSTNGTEYNLTSATNTKINNGTGWVLSAGWLSPERFTDQGFNIGRRISDVNGDGYADIVKAYNTPSFEGLTTIKNATNAFLLKKITHGYGGITEVNYKQSTLSENEEDLGFNIWLVANTSQNNSLSGDFAVSSLHSYVYSGGKFDYPTQEFRGFARVNETLPDNSKIAHLFHQDSVLKGREFQTTLYDSSGNRIRDEISLFTNSNENMIFLNSTSVQVYDGQATPTINNITFQYDSFGNVKIVNNSGDISTSGDEKLELFEYVYNTSSYVINKPSNYTLYGLTSSIVKQTFYFYDGLTTGVNRGDLTRITNYNDKGTSPSILYSYDSFGNVVKETQPLGDNTTFAYDSTGTYRTKDTNQKGHTIDYGYELGTGNLLFEVRHGLNKTYTYDTFGRMKTEIISPDTSSLPTKNYTYTLDGTAPEIIKTQAKGNGGNYSEDMYFYDGLGNPVQIKSLFNSGTQIVKNYFYDSKYRIDEEQNPYLDTYSTSLSTSTTGLKIRYQYDSFDRVTNLTKQDNSSILVIFNKTTVTQFDENNNRIDYILDAYNRIKNVLEYEVNASGTQVYTTNYSYRADGNLIRITDTKGNNFLFDYDTLGRKIVYDDPNMNNWTYSYDANSNLINQTDGRSITTFLTYDSINRLTFKKAGNSNITFAYDGQYNGTLTNITSDSDYFNVGYNKYKYDDRLRAIEESIFVCYREITPGDDECGWINYSVDYDSQDKVLKMYLPQTNLSYAYNSIGKLESVNGFLNSVNYNAFGKISNRTYYNNLITKIDYDVLGRISLLQTGAVQNLSYAYDNAGNVKSIKDIKNSKNYTMGYDSLNRLINATVYDAPSNTSSTFKYVYDPIGNLLNSYHPERNISYAYNQLAHAPTSLAIVTSQNIIEITSCGVLDFPNAVYVLQNNVSSTGTCLNVTANNVTIDGGGYTIDYALSGNGSGISSTGKYNTTNIRNVRLIADFAVKSSPGIQIRDSRELNITNVYIRTNCSSGYSNAGCSGISLVDMLDRSFITNTNLIILGSTTKSHSSHGIAVTGGTHTHAVNGPFIKNVTVYSNATNSIGVYINGGNFGIENIIIEDSNVYSDLYYGIRINGGTDGEGNVNISTVKIVSAGASTRYPLYLEDSVSGSVRDSNLSSQNAPDVYNTGTHEFINVTYNDESGPGQLIRKWYYRAYVNNTNGLAVSGTNITAYNLSGSYQFNLTTGTNGYTGMSEIVEYITQGGTKTYYSPYTIYASHSNYTAINHQINVTALTNVYKDGFTFGQLPAISFVPPTPSNGSAQSANSIYVNVSSNLSGDHYTLVDFDRDLLFWMSMENASVYDDTEDGAYGGCTDTENAYDENWETYSKNGEDPCYVYINYTIPSETTDVFSEFKISINDGNQFKLSCKATLGEMGIWALVSTKTASGTFSAEIPSTCLDNGDNTLQLYYRLNGTGEFPPAGVNEIKFYDERIWWAGLGGYVADSSSYGSDGVVEGYATQTPDGKFGYGFEFDGNGDAINLTGNSVLEAYDNVTFCGWIYPRGIGGGNDRIYGLEDATHRLGIITNRDENDTRIFRQSTVSPIYWQTTQTVDNTAPVNTWTHFCIIQYQNKTVDIYINGESVAYDTVASDPDPFTYPTEPDINIGRNRAGSAFFNGTIDEFLIFNRTLTLGEIKSLYNATATQYQNNFSSLANGTHSFTAYAVDKAGNKSQTEERVVTIT